MSWARLPTGYIAREGSEGGDAGDGSGTSAGTGCKRGGAGSGCHRVRGDHPIDVPFAICEANDVE